MKKSILTFFLLLMANLAMSQKAETHRFFGTVVDSQSKEFLVGALIQVGDQNRSAVSNENGEFSFLMEEGHHTVTVRYLGYLNYSSKVFIPQLSRLTVEMDPAEMEVGTVDVLATGYQKIPKERATGSFVHLDRELVNRRVSTGLLERLEDVTSGLVFNRAGSGNDPLSIRGRNTLFANTQPLIVIDNFPYDGPLENINPNDVENITVLKDAAAASIWGARAGNGVIVITTKQGGVSGPKLSFNSNINIVEKPDLFYRPQLSVNDYMEVEQLLFGRGFYSGNENAFHRPPLSPLVETLIAQRDGRISASQANNQIAAFRNSDIRNDLSKYFYRQTVNRQYALNLTGGNKRHTYAISSGWDDNSENVQGNSNSRITLSMKNSWKSSNDRFDLGLGVYLVRQNRSQTTELPGGTYPYDRLVDEAGNHLPITQKYSRRFIEGQSVASLLDWNYIPLDELGRSSIDNRQNDYRINLSTGYKITQGLKAELLYQYWQSDGTNENFRDPSLFYTRNLINQFTQHLSGGGISRVVPEGGIIDKTNEGAHSHTLRGQLSYNKSWSTDHELNTILGYEIKDMQAESNSVRYYGYDKSRSLSKPVDHVGRYLLFPDGYLSSVFNGIAHSGLVDRFISYYFNAGYSYKKKLDFTVSARKDASNLFGVEPNQKGVPLWSLGAGWTVSEENFYTWTNLPYLKIRGSFGYNGNIDKTLTAFTTAQFYTNGSFTLPAGELGANILNPANPLLQWERIRIYNLGLDSESKNGRVRAAVDIYQKNGYDLIGDTPLPPSTGVFRFRGNTANTRSKGLDLDVQTLNLTGRVRWQTNFLYSYIHEEVTGYYYKGAAINYLELGNIPLEGKPLFGMYSLPWGGLDPATGNPLGILEGEPSQSYAEIFNNASPETIQYHGSRRPTSFGALRNTLVWNNFSLSANISFRMGYYYRRESVRYNPILQSQGGHPDYTARWQNPGDELSTNVPSMPATLNALRDNMYNYSDVLVEKGDHIRLQDIRIGYTLDKTKMSKLPFQRAEIYGYANNIGILWKASDDPLDPDFRTMRPLRSIALGLRVDF
ncbi:SusC/RagA family TonB-linked outer membrane protein [Rhodonellum sp.]|uniref:SusC/RagA family TonB-linked outer membrane protein n=1 Tax=Rhodonellum sp. TaxID=2231180 RepID=UPI00271DF607|nr:SusC/RagA family TonB-linked outer membrane protein [Rhodonellum sp.]MDO9553267.1 SusC/RagA family TonB-linked outer membrane protein [Rhodonellum sp.]